MSCSKTAQTQLRPPSSKSSMILAPSRKRNAWGTPPSGAPRSSPSRAPQKQVRGGSVRRSDRQGRRARRLPRTSRRRRPRRICGRARRPGGPKGHRAQGRVHRAAYHPFGTEANRPSLSSRLSRAKRLSTGGTTTICEEWAAQRLATPFDTPSPRSNSSYYPRESRPAIARGSSRPTSWVTSCNSSV